MAFGQQMIKKIDDSIIEKSSIIPKLPDVIYIPDFFNIDESNHYMSQIFSEVEFQSETYKFLDKEIETKRKMSFHSAYSYSYSDQVYSGKNLTPILEELKKIIINKTGYDFNGVLCNYYENGEAGMGWHADKEKELGIEPVIASLSFGQSRRFAFRHRKDVVNLKNPPRICEYNLNNGDLLIMKGTTQQFFEHCLIKDKSCNEKRINLTFRKIIEN